MKWLILLTLITACGKHSEPAALDLRDSDGDQIQNHQEKSELNKYVANFKSLTEVKGVIRFFADKPVEIEFSNAHDLNAYTLNMITGNENQLRSEEYFSEWSKISLAEMPVLNFSQNQVQVKLEFVSGSDSPNEVLLVNGKSIMKLGSWKQQMNLTFSAQDLKDLTSGEAEIVLVKKFENKMAEDQDANETIKEKTYRVYFNDGSESKIYYVSKDLEYDRFLEMMKIDVDRDIDDDLLFFHGERWTDKRWYDRELKNGDKVLVRQSLSSLREVFLKRFTIKTTTIGRVNGQSSNSLSFMNKENAKVYLKIKSFYKTVRTFVESREVRGGGGGGRDGNGGGRCTIHRRNVSGEEKRYLPQRILGEELGTDLFNESFIDSRNDEKGNEFWQMKLEAPTPNFELKFKSYAAKTYVLTGEIESSCDYTGNKQNTHPEGKLSLEVESYVEKI